MVAYHKIKSTVKQYYKAITKTSIKANQFKAAGTPDYMGNGRGNTI